MPLVVLSSVAALGSLLGITGFAGDSLLPLSSYRSQRTIAVMDSQASGQLVIIQEAPIVLAPLKWENAQTSERAIEPFSSGEDSDNFLLLQDPGPTPSQTAQPVSPPADGNQTTQVNIITGLGNVSSDDYKPMSGKERWRYYLNQNYISMGAYFGPVLSSFIDQANGEPPEWGGGMKGYGRRVASRLGTSIIQGSTQSVGCALLGQEPRYIRSSSPRVLNRIGHAFLFSLITYNKDGKVRPAIPTLASYYVASMTTNLWMPDRYTALGDGVRDGNRQVIMAGLVNQFQEFWPEIKRLIFRRP